jgi:hypothetical protein
MVMKTIFLVYLWKLFVLIIDIWIHLNMVARSWIHLNMVARSLDIELFVVKNKLVTENYLKITSRMISSFSDGGL